MGRLVGPGLVGHQDLGVDIGAGLRHLQDSGIHPDPHVHHVHNKSAIDFVKIGEFTGISRGFHALKCFKGLNT